jgi:hypothetical protein
MVLLYTGGEVRLSVARIQIFESACCAPTNGADEGCCSPISEGEQLARFLRGRPGPTHTISVTNLAAGAPVAQLPDELVDRLRRGDPGSLPAIAVDGRLVHTGQLPNWLEALALIEHATRPGRTSGAATRG